MLKGKYKLIELDMMKKINNSVQRIIKQYQDDEKELPDYLIIDVEGETENFIIYPKDLGKRDFNLTVYEVKNINKQHIN